MTTFYMLVGLVGSGKSTFAERLSFLKDAEIVSSDKKRQEQYGDESKQGDNNALFRSIHEDILSKLKNGENVIFDATNISRKHRVELLKQIPDEIVKVCYLIATEFKICLAQNKSRERVVPEKYIWKQRESFNVPVYGEGWDNIKIVYNYDPMNYSILDFIERANAFDQKTPYHSMTLGEHSLTVAKEMEIQYSLNNKNYYYLGLLHDCGKEYTGRFFNSRGEPSNIQHFYSHEFVGAYESLFYFDNLNLVNNTVVLFSSLIEFHMRMYNMKTEKAVKKVKDLIGDSAYGWLYALHQADKKAH